MIFWTIQKDKTRGQQTRPLRLRFTSHIMIENSTQDSTEDNTQDSHSVDGILVVRKCANSRT